MVKNKKMVRAIHSMIRWTIVIGTILAARSTIALAQSLQPTLEFKQSAHLDMITPSGKFLRKGHATIGVDFTFNSIPAESIEYIGILTFNGTPYGPLTFVITPGENSVKSKMRWYVKATGEDASIRFRLIGIGNTTKVGYEFVDITKYYAIIKSDPRPAPNCDCRK